MPFDHLLLCLYVHRSGVTLTRFLLCCWVCVLIGFAASRAQQPALNGTYAVARLLRIPQPVRFP